MGCVSCRGSAHSTFVDLADFDPAKWTVLDCSSVENDVKIKHAYQFKPNDNFADVKDAWKKLENNKLGSDAKVICYDTQDGKRACKYAALLRNIGVTAHVANFKFEGAKDEFKNIKVAKADTKLEIEKSDSLFASADDLRAHVKAKKRVIDLRDAASFKEAKWSDKCDIKNFDVSKNYKSHMTITDWQKRISDAGHDQKSCIFVGDEQQAYVAYMMFGDISKNSSNQIFTKPISEWMEEEATVKMFEKIAKPAAEKKEEQKTEKPQEKKNE